MQGGMVDASALPVRAELRRPPVFSLKSLLVLFAATLAVATVVHAGNPQGMLSMCRDDARTAVRRIRERGPEEGAPLLRTVDEVCIRGKMAPEMRGLPDYEEVVRSDEEAMRLTQAAADAVSAWRCSMPARGGARGHAGVTTASVALPPGGLESVCHARLAHSP
ncbi:hypothetical protein BHS04_08515 [Myxococcus xanthus]|nr:hypothetical protein BHS04_08515 [Myxococcus xanthus]